MTQLDSVFGIYINDRLKLINHRVRVAGLQHRHNITPLDPNPDEDVTIHAITPGKAAFEQVALYYTTDGSEPSGSRGSASNGNAVAFIRANLEWDALAWDYVVHWEAIIPGQPDQTMVQYRITAWRNDGDEVKADTPNVDDKVQYECMLDYNSLPEDKPYVDTGHFYNEDLFNYHVDTYQTPDWAEDAIIYQIFVDRFYPGDGREWVQTTNLGELCGGTLWGVRDKLDYLKDLGVTCLWISPPWASPSFHGYDVMDYDYVDAKIGGNAALTAVVEGAHQRDMRVLLDLVPNHLSNEHPFFVEALNDPTSPYRDWFFFDDRVINGYKGFFQVETMPRINLNHPGARDWMVANAVKWVREYDIDGYRIDVIDGAGPNFWNYLRKALRDAKADVLTFGELIDVPQRMRIYAGRVDGILDFPLNEAIRHTYAQDGMTENQFETFVALNDAFYPQNFLRPTFLDNHDMNRFLFLAGNDTEKVKRAATRQMQLRKPAIIYNGTEVGVPQSISLDDGGFHVVREVMRWGDEQDKDLLAFYRNLLNSQ